MTIESMPKEPTPLPPLTPAYLNDCLRSRLLDQNKGRSMEQILRDFARKGLHEAVEVVIDLGVNINAKDPKGKTALDYATAAGRQKTAELLIKNGAEYGQAKPAKGPSLNPRDLPVRRTQYLQADFSLTRQFAATL